MPEDASIGAQARRGIAWSAATFVGSKAITFVSTIILARLLAPSQFGLVAAVLVYVQFLELGSDLGLGATVIYEQEEGQTDRVDTAFTINVAIGVGLALIGIALAPLIAGFFHAEAHADLFRLASVSLIFSGFGGISDAMLLRDLEFNRRIIPQLGRGVVRGGVSIVMAALGFGALSLVVGLLAGSLVTTIIQWSLTRFRPRFHIERGALRAMLTYGGASTLLELLALVGGNTDVAAIGRVLGARALGLYTIAFRVPELLIENVAWNVSTVAFPALARKRALDEGGLPRATMKLVHYQTLYAAPVGAGIAVLSPALIVTLFGSNWRQAAGVMSAIAVMCIVSSAEFALGDLFKASGRPGLLVLLNLAQVPLIIAAVVLLAPKGILWVAWARAASMVLHAGIVSATACRTSSMVPRDLVRAIGSGAAAALGVVVGAGAVRLAWSSPSLAPLIAGTVAGSVGAVVSLRLLAPATLAEIREILSRIPLGGGRRLARTAT